MTCRRFVVVVILAVAAAVAANAQTLYGSLTGNVTDGTGAGVPAAKVEAHNTATNVLRQTTTDDHGSFVSAIYYRARIASPSPHRRLERA